MIVPFRVDNRIRLVRDIQDPALIRALKDAFSHSNPDYHKKKASKFSTYATPPKINTWREEGGQLTFARGSINRVRDIVKAHGYEPRFADMRLLLPAVDWPTPKREPRDYQQGGIDAGLKFHQGIMRAPTGAGKTTFALLFAALTRQPTLIIMRSSMLLEQWKERAIDELGLAPKEIGILKGGGNLKVGKRLTLALQQTLHSKSFPLADVAQMFGTVIGDECQGLGAETFQNDIDMFPAYYRIGVSADETRKDKLDFLIYDMMGEVIYEVTRRELEQRGVIIPVDVRLIPTDFTAQWYADAQGPERDFNALLLSMMGNEAREEQLRQLIRQLADDGETPTLIFSHRVEHARRIADEYMLQMQIRCGLLLGNAENSKRFEEDKRRLLAGSVEFAAGTFMAIGQGIDIPNVRAGIIATPFGNNRQFFGQVRGRICRTSPKTGKTTATLYVLWDRAVFPQLPRTLSNWNDGRTYVLTDDGSWRAV